MSQDEAEKASYSPPTSDIDQTDSLKPSLHFEVQESLYAKLIEWTSLVDRFLPRQIATTLDTIKWYLNIHERYLLMETLTKEDASNSSTWVCWCCKCC
ncbi:hypothetical protein Hanom_Chr04g00329171 [Helianthus anomalus]